MEIVCLDLFYVCFKFVIYLLEIYLSCKIHVIDMVVSHEFVALKKFEWIDFSNQSSDQNHNSTKFCIDKSN